jgi:Sec-independent protein secretion pathway component TatC
MFLIMIPLLVLYEGSIVIARRFGRPGEDRVGTEVSPGEAGS